MISLSIATYLFATFVVVTSVYFTLHDSATRKRMKAKEDTLNNIGVTAYGSTLSHGMVYHKKTEEIKADQKESLMWYRRLLD